MERTIHDSNSFMERRSFLQGMGCATLFAAASLAGCSPAEKDLASDAGTTSSANNNSSPQLSPLPPSSPDESQFHVDKNINMETIDNYLGREDVEYTDMRMIHDPADYAAVGGDSDLTVVLEGFKVVPFPYVGTLQELPVEGAYQGPCLFAIEWAEDGTVANAIPNYEESLRILEDLFPKDKTNFIMCGGAGYAHMTVELLKYLGWDSSKLYNVGGAWDYTGYHAQELARVDGNGQTHFYTWKVTIPNLDFSLLNPA